MNKLQLVKRLSLMLIVFISIFSCKKEPDGNRLMDGDVRIIKVQRTTQTNSVWGLAPFFNRPGLVVYEYDDNDFTKYISFFCSPDKVTNCDGDLSSPVSFFYKVNSIKSGELNFKVDYIFEPFADVATKAFLTLDEINIDIKNGALYNISSSMSVKPNPIGVGLVPGFLKYRIRYNDSVSRNNHSFSAKVESIDMESNPELEGELLREELESSSSELTKFKEFSTTMKAFFNGSYPIVNEEDYYTENLNYEVSYSQITGVPTKLIGLINAAIIGYLKTGIDDHPSIRYQAFLTGENADINQPYFSDWMFLFGLAPYLDQISSDKIVNNVKITGKRHAFQLAYQYDDINSSISFPYTHDPVARTLEIAGLKIWYEVVE